jgi:hypothetical protein
MLLNSSVGLNLGERVVPIVDVTELIREAEGEES